MNNASPQRGVSARWIGWAIVAVLVVSTLWQVASTEVGIEVVNRHIHLASYGFAGRNPSRVDSEFWERNCSITPRSARGPAALVAGVD